MLITITASPVVIPPAAATAASMYAGIQRPSTRFTPARRREMRLSVCRNGVAGRVIRTRQRTAGERMPRRRRAGTALSPGMSVVRIPTPRTAMNRYRGLGCSGLPYRR